MERHLNAHGFWIAVYSEPALLDMDGIELVLGDFPTGRQFNAPRRYCGNYAQVAKALFMERMSRMGEIKAEEARGEKTTGGGTKVAGARKAKPEEPINHDIRKLQQDGQPEGYRRRLLDSDDEALRELNTVCNLPVDLRAAARSAEVVRRYVPLAVPKRPCRRSPSSQ